MKSLSESIRPPMMSSVSSSVSSPKTLIKFPNYLEVEKCIHDLLTQQMYLKQKKQLGFVWIRKIMYTVDPSTNETFYYNEDIDMLCPYDPTIKHFNVTYFIPSFPCKTFPKTFDQNIYEYALAKFILSKASSNTVFNNTKVGRFLDRCFERKASGLVPIFI